MNPQERKKLISEITLLQKIKAGLLARKGLKDLFYFNREILEKGNPERQRNIVPHVHGKWWKWFKNCQRMHRMLLVPRNTLKSTFFTVGLTLQEIAKNPDVRILIANAKLDNAVKFLGEIKRHIKDNQAFRENYGDFYNPDGKWTETEIEVRGRTAQVREPTVMAAGVGVGLAGTHWDLIIGDDLMNEVNSMTREQADKVIDWWKRSISLLDPKTGHSLTIGTRWAFYDLYQYVMDELSEQVDIYIRTAYNLDGTPYYPELLDERELNRIRRLEGSYIFSSFYLNDPIDPETSLIKHHQIHYIGNCDCGETHIKPDRLAFFGACDPAVSQKATADRSAICVVGVDERQNWWVDYAGTGKYSVHGLIERLFKLHEEYGFEMLTLEVIGQAQLLTQHIHEIEISKNQFLPLKLITTRANIAKGPRLRSSLQPRFERGKVFIDRSMTDLEDQLTRYPRSKYDDLLDCLSDISEVAFSPSGQVEVEAKQESNLERRVARHFAAKENPVIVDSVLGEYF